MKTRKLGIVLGAFALFSSMAAAAIAEPGGTPPVPKPSATGSVDAVTDTAEALGSFWAEPGFGKTVVDYEAATVTVHWKGAPPSEVAEMAASNDNGVKVVIKPATFSDAELVTASRTILDVERKLTGSHTIAAVLPNADLSGLIVELTTGTVTAKEPSLAEARYEALTDIPVAIELVAEDPVLTTRQNDSAPWQGGGAMADSTGDDYCTTGFAILENGTDRGLLLSAGHCNNDGAVIRDGVGDRIGIVADVAPAYDSMIINPDASPATIGKVFGGPWNAGTGHNRYQFFVGGSSAPSQGEEVCVSGARSGEHCNRTIRATSVTFDCYTNLSQSCTGFRASGDGDGVTQAVGDSGDPIYIERTDGRVGARGIGVVASGQVPCGSTAEPTTCYRTVYAVGIHNLLDRWGARIET